MVCLNTQLKKQRAYKREVLLDKTEQALADIARSVRELHRGSHRDCLQSG